VNAAAGDVHPQQLAAPLVPERALTELVLGPQSGRYPSYGSKSFLRAPQTGQNQSSGMSVNAVPAGMPPSGSPSAGS
jgi:hypothetical protein